MKLVSSLNRTLENWLAKQGITNIEVCEGSDFCYYYETHCIQWGLFENSKVENQFHQFLDEYGLNLANYSSAAMAFLHEVGHVMTLPNFTEEEHQQDIYNKDSRVSNCDIETNYWYWELPTEFAANMWAINWVNSHINEFCELNDIFNNWLELIYADEDITGQMYEWKALVEDGEYPGELFIYEEDYE